MTKRDEEEKPDQKWRDGILYYCETKMFMRWAADKTMRYEGSYFKGVNTFDEIFAQQWADVSFSMLIMCYICT